VLGRDRALARIDDAVAFLRHPPGASAA